MRSAVNVDSSADVLALGVRNQRLNGLSPGLVEDVVGDAFEVLRELRRGDARFDVIVVDPPKFAYTRRDVERAARGYKDINMQAFHLLAPGGLLYTFSCSGAVSDDLFQKIVFGAALDAGRRAHIIGKLMQNADHPVSLMFPEASYLKGLVCRATS
jgi:23S rRNA (cytosine1962-C5)-methyltransferase